MQSVPIALPHAAVPPEEMPAYELIGELTGHVAGCLGEAGQLLKNGCDNAQAKHVGVAVLALLYEARLRALETGELSPVTFETIARLHGARALRERWGARVTEEQADFWVDCALELLRKVTIAMLN